MLEKVKIIPDSYLSEILLAQEYNLNNPVALLFGGNGVGKSTLIRALLSKEEFAGQCIPVINPKISPILFEYINSEQNSRELMSGKNKHMKYLDYFDAGLIAKMFDAQELSEGQSIIYTIQELLQLAKEQDNPQGQLFIIDEIDSGLSIDNIIWFCDEIKKIIKMHPLTQFLISFNSYEMCAQFNGVVTDMYTGEIIEIKSYEEYKKLLLKRRKGLLKKRKNNQFREFYTEEKK